MGKIAGMLERSLAECPVHPVIVEFSTLDAMRELAPSVRDISGMKEIGFPHAPAGDIFPLKDRVLSRFQAGLFSFKQIPRFKMLATILSADMIEELVADPNVVRVYLDQIQTIFQTVPSEGVFEHRKKRYTTTPWVRKLVGADKANEEGWTGAGVRLAIVDTGGSPALPQTSGFTYISAMREKAQLKDKNGHGEHVASTACGRRYYDRTLKHEVMGMAPTATGILIKVLGWIVGAGSQSDVIEGLSISLDRGADIVNLSLGSNTMPDDPEEDAEYKPLMTLIENSVIPVIAIGNSGPGEGSAGTPGCFDEIISVGAWNEIDGGVNDFSSRGPTKWGTIRPTIVAPGYNIYSQTLGILDMLDGLENRMAFMSGTSMATPVASGILACARQMFQTRAGVVLTADLVDKICAMYGHAPNNSEGYGPIHFSWFERYLREELV